MEYQHDILTCVDEGITLRPVQVEFLKFVQENWESTDVFVGNLAVGSGKSRVLTTIGTWANKNGLGSTAGIAPTKILQDQFENDFPWLRTLKGADNYQCQDHDTATCGEFKRATKKYCQTQCRYLATCNQVRSDPVALFNFHSYTHIKDVEKNIVVIDEAHNLPNFLSSQYSMKLWKFQWEYPEFESTPYKGIDGERRRINPSVMIEWIKDQMAELKVILTNTKNADEDTIKSAEDDIRVLDNILYAFVKTPDDMLVIESEEMFKGRGKQLHTSQKYIAIRPLNVSKFMSRLYTTNTRKMILLSGTINESVIKKVGLSNKRVSYFTGENPIPAANRPFLVWPIASMSYKSRKESVPKIVTAIQSLAAKHINERGVIHATYEIAEALKKVITSKRFMFHDQKNKSDVYQKFRASGGNSILVASGMSEGIDLPDDLATWQAICVLQKPSLKDDVNWHNIRYDREWYEWETALLVRQATGRISRHINDTGKTYMLDADFVGFWHDTYTKRKDIQKFWPKDFVDSMKWSDGVDRS